MKQGKSRRCILLYELLNNINDISRAVQQNYRIKKERNIKHLSMILPVNAFPNIEFDGSNNVANSNIF